jgi:hypothetical protein
MRIGEGILGVLLMFCAGCLKPEERAKVHNFLDDMYNRTLEASDTQLSGMTRILRAVANVTERVFARLWGDRFFSVRAVFVSLAVSMGLALLSQAQMETMYSGMFARMPHMGVASARFDYAAFREVSYALMLLIFTAAQAAFPRWRTYVFPVAVTVIVTWTYIDLKSFMFGSAALDSIIIHDVGPDMPQDWDTKSPLFELEAFAGSVLVSTTLDVLVVALVRTWTRWMSHARSLWPMLAFLGLDAIVCSPFAYLMFFFRPTINYGFDLIAAPDLWWRLWPNILNMSQGDAAVCVLFVVIGATILLNHGLWFIFRRIMFAFSDMKILDRQKWFFTSGVCLLADALTDYGGRLLVLFRG